MRGTDSGDGAALSLGFWVGCVRGSGHDGCHVPGGQADGLVLLRVSTAAPPGCATQPCQLESVPNGKP